jgi:hypothetical protein
MSGHASPRQRGGRQEPPTPGPRPTEATQVERVRTEVDRLCWGGILLGLAFTMTNVQTFAAAGSRPWSLPWLAAWLLDPMVSLVLLAILRAEQTMARYHIRAGGWVRAAKWFTLAATYVMNTWSAFTAHSAALVVLHSVPPLVVFVAAEAVTDLRDKLIAAVSAAFMNVTDAPAAHAEPTRQDAPEDRAPMPKRRPSGPRSRTGTTAPRKSFDAYLAEARAAWHPGVTVTPAWVRQVTSCSRGLSSRLAAALTNELHQPDSAAPGTGRQPESEGQGWTTATSS